MILVSTGDFRGEPFGDLFLMRYVFGLYFLCMHVGIANRAKK